MTFAWKTAGLTYNRYLSIAARTVQRSLKPEIRAKVEGRAIGDLKFSKWENGKQGEPKSLASVTAGTEAASK
ncbi:hypothetical protein FQN57_003342 [Myotisia sp. PD_48]|nr:hypothetical protein FQN57_003342 [Myotisia sp. PD_48]